MVLKYLFTLPKQSLVRTIYHCKNKQCPAYLYIKSLLNPILSLYMITLRCFKLRINREEHASGKFSEKRDPTWSQTTSISNWDAAKNEENRAANIKSSSKWMHDVILRFELLKYTRSKQHEALLEWCSCVCRFAGPRDKMYGFLSRLNFMLYSLVM